MKKGKISTRVLAFVICVMMFVGIVPMATFAESETGKFSNSQLSLVQDKQSTLASGVTQNIYTVYDKNGKQVKMFAATIDMSVDTVKLFTSYKIWTITHTACPSSPNRWRLLIRKRLPAMFITMVR